MRCFPAIFLALASCAIAPPPEKRINVVLRNSTDQRLEFQAHVGLLGSRLEIPPGYTWRGWVLRDFVGREIVVEIVPSPLPAPSRQGNEAPEDCDRDD